MRLGLQQDDTMQVPPGPTPAGWYVLSTSPGQAGAAVIAGHVTYNGARGVFFSLGTLAPGATVDVRRQDGVTARFTVYAVQQYAKSKFPTQNVYGSNGIPELRLITCAGDYNRAQHRYADNLVVFARLSGQG